MFINIMSEPPAKGGESWMDDARCKAYDSTLWILSENPKDRELNKRRFEQAEIICSTCPVITECWQAATYVDKLVTMRGGAWPEEYRAPKDTARYKLNNEPVRKETCVNGHDTRDPKSRAQNGQCLKCRRAQENLRRAKKAGRLGDTEKLTG